MAGSNLNYDPYNQFVKQEVEYQAVNKNEPGAASAVVAAKSEALNTIPGPLLTCLTPDDVRTHGLISEGT